MSYKIKEIFGPTIQGEGAMAGMPCVFVRFSGCNMWDGRQETKAKSGCPYCDTDFRDGEKYTASEVVDKVKGAKWVWISGGEPFLQLDNELLLALKGAGLLVAVETNGTKKPKFDTDLIDHISLSPKKPFNELELDRADSIKVLYPHPHNGMEPEQFNKPQFGKLFIQPCLDAIEGATEKAMDYVLENPQWRLSIQTHKILGIA
jgi:organic radical activating enzyme